MALVLSAKGEADGLGTAGTAAATVATTLREAEDVAIAAAEAAEIEAYCLAHGYATE
jgi:hypothetical protein